MNISRPNFSGLASRLCLLITAFLAVASAQAGTISVNVVDSDGVAVDGFRWVLQEDKTFPVDPSAPSTDPNELLSLGFHASYHPVAQNGNVDTGTAVITTGPGRYYVSVLPYSGYSISGGQAEIVNDADTATVTVTVQKHPVPTAQIAVYLFQDNYPLNGAPDLPEETNPLPGVPGHVDWTRFNIVLEEPAGRYGQAGGPVIQDAFGNPLGTTYIKGCDADGVPDTDPFTNFGCLDADGMPIVDVLGDGTLSPLSDGTLLVENLAPGKYGIIVVPPSGAGWQQSSTIEGTKVIDAWVKANEPPFFVEFGPPGPHVFIGFTKEFNFLSVGGGTATVSGTITDMHMSRPPAFEFFSGRPFPGCWIGVNESNPAGLGRALYAGPCAADSSFSIPFVRPGSYQLKVFDTNLDAVIASQGFTVDPSGGTCNGGGSCDFGEVAVFNWFTRLNTGVFNDADQDGFWDADEAGIGPESQSVSLRWRDGTIYQSFPTDGEGFAPFDEVFPFFHWLVAEVSFANKKATGATFVVDAGGDIPAPDPALGGIEGFPSFGELNPQPQAENAGLPYRTETGPVLTTAFQGFLGQTSVMLFGKTDYRTLELNNGSSTFIGENGGISGIVYYATTRAEDDPQLAAAEVWEPGVPRVQVNLYADGDIDSFPVGDFPNRGLDGIIGTADDTYGDVDWNGDGIRDLDDGVIDDIDGDNEVTLADVDNYPFGNFPGSEDIDRNGNSTFDLGDAVQVTTTDSWDDNLPTNCQGANNVDAAQIGLTGAVDDNRCFDGLRNFNQVRPGVFDGGYAFADYDLTHLGTVSGGAAADIQNYYDTVNANVAGADKLQLGLIPGDYIVEAVTPPGYKLMKEEDKNVDFGDEYIPSSQAVAATCVGDSREVPPYLSMATKDGSGALDQLIPGIDPVAAAAPFAGESRPLCDRKQVPLSSGQNAAAEFWVMTDVPVVGNVSGVILNDLGNEFNPNSPAFGEKYAPPNVPVGFYDWNGKEVARVYADKYGRYNAVVPSTFTTNLPQPSGMSPNMLVSCMNDAGTGTTPDPFWNPQFSQFCYTFQYMPGVITYLDTPVEPIAAFASPVTYPVDCEMPNSTPRISHVTRDDDTGPYALPGETINVTSMSAQTEVANPDWDGTLNTTRVIERDYSFSGCTVELEDAFGNRVPLDNGDCTGIDALTGNTQASGDVPLTMAAGTYQVVVTNGDGAETPTGVTLTVGPFPNNQSIWRVGNGGDFTTIQAAIDGAAPGDLILVGPKADGTAYDELVIMYKPVKLQGWGPGLITINGRQTPTEKVNNWRTKAQFLLASGAISQLPGQAVGVAGFPALAEAIFPTEEGAAIFVAGKSSGNGRFSQNRYRGARIDGFNIIGSSTGGGIVVNGYAPYLQIGNNRIVGNAGAFGGGIRIGHPQLSHQLGNGTLVYDDSENDFVRVHHNHIAMNGGRGGAGGGLSLHTGADDYTVTKNRICANFSAGNGGGIGHLGLSNNGLIADNEIIFNESFSQADAQSGGGIFIGGQPQLDPAALQVSPGTGSVTVDSNLIRGNLAGAGDGGGIQLASVNGMDVDDDPRRPQNWYQVDVINNMINNNVAALAGGGIAIQDSVRVNIINNTVAHNDTTATAALAFAPGAPNRSNATPAGIVARTHTADFGTLMGTATVPDPDWALFSDAAISDSIVEHNRSFFWLNFDDPGTPAIETGLFPANCASAPTGCDLANVGGYTADLAVMSGPFTVADPLDVGLLDPQYSLLTDTTDYAATNTSGDPGFVKPYFNGALGDGLDIAEFTTIATAGAFDEGGNFIQVAFSPLSLIDSATGEALDYHIGAGAAVDAGSNILLIDIDDDPRPQGVASDIGADETAP